jgi:hypothetical protein
VDVSRGNCATGGVALGACGVVAKEAGKDTEAHVDLVDIECLDTWKDMSSLMLGV